MSTCRVCGAEVQDGNFCGRCGSHRTVRRGDGPDWLRLRSYVAAPHQHVLLPAVGTSLFPQLSARDARSFRIGLAVMLAVLVAAAEFRRPGAFIATVAVGIPLLFVLYLRGVDYARQMPGRLVVAGGLGIGFGGAFALLSGAVVARSYGVPLENGLAAVHLRVQGAGVSAVGVLLALAPAVIIRLFGPGRREPLRGFAIGACGALAMAATTTAVRMFAQLESGLVDRDQPLSDLLIEAGIRGITVPIAAAAAGGMVGAALWFEGRARDRRVRWAVLLFAMLSVVGHLWLGGEDSAAISQWAKAAWHVGVAVIALMLLRLGLQLALLHQDSGDRNGDPEHSVACSYCGNIVPSMAFCSECGVAMAGRDRPGAATISAGRLAITWTAVVAVLGAGLIGLSVARTHPAERYMCPPNCGPPPMGRAVVTNPVFTAPDGMFDVSYPAPGTAYSVTTDARGVTADFTGGDGGVMRLFGEPANGRDAKEVVSALVQRWYPDSRVAYEIPNTLVGYHPGYGVALDDWPDGENVGASRTRVLVMVAVKDDLALIAAAVGPYRELGSESGPPTGASLELAADMGKYVNSFRWQGDPPR
ncbi:hypothetical protein ABIA30_002016 [Mycobacterium sp. MAA66]